MKNLTNILSYLWLLLLMAVTACSDLEEEVGPMQGEEEVELTIQTEVSGMKGSTRTAPTENITAITAYAFDSNSQLIKVVKAILLNQAATNGNLRIKVPKRTGDIHFIAKNNAESPDVTISIGENVSTLLSQTTDDLHYWGKATYNEGNNLSVTLIRNMAKVTLTLNNNLQGHIAGFVNYNQTGTLVPGNFEVGTLNATNDVASHSNGDLGAEHYLFEHANVENSNPLYVIIEVADKYYKVAFAAGDEYFPIIRNHEYTITIDGIDAMYAENNYTDAVNSQYPINDLVITNVPMTVTPNPAEVLNESGQTFTVTVTIPEGITELNVPTHDAFDITPPNSLTPQNGKYSVTQGSYEFTFTVKEDVEAGDKTISFSGRGKYKSATGSAKVNLYEIENVELDITPDAPTVGNTEGSTTQLTVQIPDGITSLTVTTDAFDVATPEGVTLENGTYNVSGKQGQSITFTLTLKANDTAGETKTVTFNGSGQKKTGTKEVTVTLAEMIIATPSATTLNYAASSVEDLLVNVTIPKKVTGLTFSSSDFTIKVVGNELQPTEGVYTITHDENATETTIPVRIRLNDEVSAETASFTFDGTSNDENVIVQSDTKSITLSASSDANVRWQGNVPLNGNVYATIVPLMYEWFHDGNDFIPAGSKLNLEFTVTGGEDSWLQVFEICGITPETDWNNPVHQFAELNGSNIYTATENGNITLSLTLSEATFTTISQNYRNDFLGEAGDANKIALAIRGTGITLTKVSVIPQILVTAPGATEGVSEASVNINYSNSTAIEEYTIRVAVPDGVTQLNYTNNGFSKVYIDNENGWYNEVPQTIDTSNNKDIALKLLVNKEYNANPTITFSAANVESATFTVNRTAGESNANVLWEGALQFQGYAVNVSKIAISNSAMQGKLLDGAVLTLEYEVVNDNNDFITICGSGLNSWANLNNMAEDGEYTDNNSSMITMTLNPTIIENIGSSDLNMQGNGRVLKKVTLTPPADVQFNVLEETVSLDLATNEVVLNVQKPANVTQLTITDNENLFGTVSTTFANANVNGKTISNLPNYAATIPVKLEITRVVDIKKYTITVSTNDGRSDNVTINLLSTWSGSHNLGNWEGFWGSARKLPVGSTVQITFADYNNCSFELHTYNSSTEFGYDVRLRDFSTTADGEDYISTSHLTNGVFTFTVATDGSVMIRNNGNLNNVSDAGLDGLQINGGNGLSITQVNVTLGGGEITPTEFTYNFEDGVKFGGWNNNITTDIVYDPNDQSNKVLKIVVADNEHNFGQIGISNGDYSGSYTLSLWYKAEISEGQMNLVFQDEANDYAERGKYVEGTLSTSWREITWNLNFTEHADQFVIQFEHVPANAVFYIDDLKLVKN